MKKLITFIFIILVVNNIYAQEIGFGIKAGVNISNVEGDFNKLPGQFGAFIGEYEQFFAGLNRDLFESESKIGAHGGLFFDIPISERFSISPEILYSMKGVDFAGVIDTSGQYTQYITYVNPVTGNIDTAQVITYSGTATMDYDISYQLHYIDIPIMAKYKFTNGLYLSAGPYISLLASSQFRYDATLDIYVTQSNSTTPVIDQVLMAEETVKSKEGLESFELGFAAGIGYEFPFGLGINARYSRGLTEVFSRSEDDGFRNSVIQFGLSYKIFGDLFSFR